MEGVNPRISMSPAIENSNDKQDNVSENKIIESTKINTDSSIAAKNSISSNESEFEQKNITQSNNNTAGLQSDNSSNKSTGDINAVKQDSPDQVVQVANSSQGSSFNDQQQKKFSDGSKNSDANVIGQIANDFSTKTTDSIKETLVNPTSSTDSSVKTVKITDITKEISDIIQQNNSKTVVMQLKPESLGKIQVTVDVNNNAVSAKVVVDTEAVKQIVQNNTMELRQSLNSNGMQLSSLSVNVSGGEQKSYQSHTLKKKSGYQTSDRRVENNESLGSAKVLGYNTYEYLI
jgi:flagellar hook-length control protein FliK